MSTPALERDDARMSVRPFSPSELFDCLVPRDAIDVLDRKRCLACREIKMLDQFSPAVGIGCYLRRLPSCMSCRAAEARRFRREERRHAS